jgi:hypothetical protein
MKITLKSNNDHNSKYSIEIGIINQIIKQIIGSTKFYLINI